ncbi:hypothetical protein ACFL3S_12995, partial [Gemmatimonadota bacterium]
NWNRIGYLLRGDLVVGLLLSDYIRGTRRAILLSYRVAKPWIDWRQEKQEKEGDQSKLWDDFRWLKEWAEKKGDGEPKLWNEQESTGLPADGGQGPEVASGSKT